MGRTSAVSKICFIQSLGGSVQPSGGGRMRGHNKEARSAVGNEVRDRLLTALRRRPSTRSICRCLDRLPMATTRRFTGTTISVLANPGMSDLSSLACPFSFAVCPCSCAGTVVRLQGQGRAAPCRGGIAEKNGLLSHRGGRCVPATRREFLPVSHNCH